MCQILKMSYNQGNMIIEVSSSRELVNATFELYVFDFLKGEYPQKAYIKHAISGFHMSQESGIYTFKNAIPSNCKVKCVIAEGDRCLVSKERFMGDGYRIEVSTENTEIGILYKIKSDVSISKKLIFYKTRSSSTTINLPADLIAGEPLLFTIQDRSFKPKFECNTEFIECFKIEG